MSEPQSQQLTKTSNILPWLRFWCNLVFCVLFLTSFIIAGYHLVKNTKPQGSKNIIKLIETIKETAKTEMTQHQTKGKPKVEQQPEDIPSSNSDSLETNKLPSENIVNTTVESSKAEGHLECYTIRLDDFENALKTVALASRQEAADDYHKSFSILITILTIFGIGFPIIIALIQHSFNERDLDKIDIVKDKTEIAINDAAEAVKRAMQAITDANEAITKAENATKQANNGLVKAEESLKENKKLKNEILNLSQDLNDQCFGFNYMLAICFVKQNASYNISVASHGNAFLSKIKELEIITKKDDIDNERINVTIKIIDTIINELIDLIKKLKEEETELLPLKDVSYYLNSLFDKSQNVLVEIKNKLPESFHNAVDNLQKNIQNGKNIITEKTDKSNQNDK